LITSFFSSWKTLSLKEYLKLIALNSNSSYFCSNTFIRAFCSLFTKKQINNKKSDEKRKTKQESDKEDIVEKKWVWMIKRKMIRRGKMNMSDKKKGSGKRKSEYKW
jgi:hypothetical protein